MFYYMDISGFVEKCIIIYNGRYSYDYAEKIDGKKTICIICPEHGIFWTTPKEHLSGCGCPKCNSKQDLYTICERVSKMCETKKDFKINFTELFWISKRKTWLRDFVWLKRAKRVTNYTHEKCYELSRLCKTRTEFARKYSRAWKIAKDNEWDDCFDGLSNVCVYHDDDVDTVYCYIFKETKHVYVGRCLKRRVIERHNEHSNPKINDTVYKYCTENNCKLPPMTIIIDSCSLQDGVEKEGYYMQYYINMGYTLINKQPAGSTGAIRYGKWTHKKCQKAALQCKTLMEFEERFAGAYSACLRHKWTDVLDEAFPNRRHIYTDEEMISIMKQYTLISKFKAEHASLYRRAKKKDLLKLGGWMKKQNKGKLT